MSTPYDLDIFVMREGHHATLDSGDAHMDIGEAPPAFLIDSYYTTPSPGRQPLGLVTKIFRHRRSFDPTEFRPMLPVMLKPLDYVLLHIGQHLFWRHRILVPLYPDVP